MNGRDPDVTRGAASAQGSSRSSLDGLIGALIGRRVRDGGVVLHGRAGSSHAKQLAQDAAMAVTDLSLTANEIEVTPSRHGQTGPDAAGEGAAAGPDE